MTARRELMIAAVLTRLQLVPGVTLVLRQPNAQPSSFPALVLDDRGQRLVEAGAIHNLFEISLAITGYVAGSGATVPAAANALHAGVIRALFIDGAQLGGIAELVTEGDTAVDTATLDQEFTTIFETQIAVQYRCRTHDPALL